MRVLFSFAHPDDESFCGAGLACWCRDRGADVVLVCATRGDAGKAGAPEVSGAPADVGAARARELEDAVGILGITGVRLLEYRDGQLAGADSRWCPEAGPAHQVRRLLWTLPVPPWTAPRSRNLEEEPGVDFVIDISRWRDRKARALRAHRTQHGSIDRHAARPSSDIFDGLVEEAGAGAS